MVMAYGFTQYGDAGTQAMLDLPKPEPGPGQILVKVHAAGVNPVDWKIRSGLLSGAMTLQFPAVLGREVAGTVAALGPGVERYEIGDEIFGNTGAEGGYTEYTLVRTDAIARKPPTVSFIDAAALPVAAATAYDAIEQLQLRAGDTLLINGAGGGVGAAATQIARYRGVGVVGTASAAKHGFVAALGAMPITYGDGVAERLHEAAPNGVTAILDLVGGDALREVAGAANDSHLIVTTADPETAASLGGAYIERGTLADTLARIAELAAHGSLSPHVQELFSLEQAGEALAAVESGHAQGKVVIEMM
ncbi:NADP-dependent oxidoreductase [Speluncibacter jeojiensis]|uniref:NADP-dependent oxidoreductase n=1 Tax=Speluncibacter jeojiensis TaxID=2710754 RepID=A0A9X4M382_9ACTN|nr:NADP-dependent oxidoreductase [Corynebacteriales bacterium D3-21]